MPAPQMPAKASPVTELRLTPPQLWYVKNPPPVELEGFLAWVLAHWQMVSQLKGCRLLLTAAKPTDRSGQPIKAFLGRLKLASSQVKAQTPPPPPLTPTGPPLPLEFSMIECMPNTAEIQPTQMPTLKIRSGPSCPCQEVSPIQPHHLH
jgi:hypothetical protein